MSDIAQVNVDGEPVPFTRDVDGVIRFSLPHPVSTHEVTIVEATPPVPGPPSLRPRERCPDCGKVPGKWHPTVSARRDELTFEECRTCGAAWTGRVGSRIGRAKP